MTFNSPTFSTRIKGSAIYIPNSLCCLSASVVAMEKILVVVPLCYAEGVHDIKTMKRLNAGPAVKVITQHFSGLPKFNPRKIDSGC